MNKNIHTCFRSTININEREPVQDFVKDTLLSLFTQNEKKKDFLRRFMMAKSDIFKHLKVTSTTYTIFNLKIYLTQWF